MKPKPFWQTNTFLVLFCIAFWMLMFLAVPSQAAGPKYKGHAKQEREYRNRRASNQSEQYRIQSPGIKKYNPNNSWQKGRR